MATSWRKRAGSRPSGSGGSVLRDTGRSMMLSNKAFPGGPLGTISVSSGRMIGDENWELFLFAVAGAKGSEEFIAGTFRSVTPSFNGSFAKVSPLFVGRCKVEGVENCPVVSVLNTRELLNFEAFLVFGGSGPVEASAANPCSKTDS